jgi:putative membrane protein
MKPFISPDDQARIEAAIQAAEANTRAELVAVVTERSDDYRYVVIAWAAVIGLALPFPWSLGLLSGPWSIPPGMWVHGVGLVAFLAVLALGQLDPVKRLMTPKSLRHRRASRFARAQFYVQRMRMTRERAGVLLFVSAFEHHVEIIADDNAAKAVSDDQWRYAVDAFIETLRSDGPAEALNVTVAILDKTLSEALPGGSGDANELPNRLIILD